MKRLFGSVMGVMAFCGIALAATSSIQSYSATRMYPVAACSAATSTAADDRQAWLSRGWTPVSQTGCDCRNVAMETRCNVEVTYWRP